MHKTGTIYGINGPVIYLKGNTGFQMAEMVYVGKERLVGEVNRPALVDITAFIFLSAMARMTLHSGSLHRSSFFTTSIVCALSCVC